MKRAAAVLAASLLAACSIAPQPLAPVPVGHDGFRHADPSTNTSTNTSPDPSTATRTPSLAAWPAWFGDPQLSALVDAALAHNLDIARRRARRRCSACAMPHSRRPCASIRRSAARASPARSTTRCRSARCTTGRFPSPRATRSICGVACAAARTSRAKRAAGGGRSRCGAAAGGGRSGRRLPDAALRRRRSRDAHARDRAAAHRARRDRRPRAPARRAISTGCARRPISIPRVPISRRAAGCARTSSTPSRC